MIYVGEVREAWQGTPLRGVSAAEIYRRLLSRAEGEPEDLLQRHDLLALAHDVALAEAETRRNRESLMHGLGIDEETAAELAQWIAADEKRLQNIQKAKWELERRIAMRGYKKHCGTYWQRRVPQ